MENKPLLTLYALPGDNSLMDDFNKIRKTLEWCGLGCEFIVLNHRDELTTQIPETEWWGFLFGNEWFDTDLISVLSIYLTQSRKGALTFYKKIRDKHKEPKFYLATRIFKTHLVPPGIETYKSVESLDFEICLDGWLCEVDRI